MLKSQGFKNAIWSLFSSGSYPVLFLFATPVFLQKLGDSQYGAWVLINTVLQLMSSINFGLGDSNIKFISESQASGDNCRTANVVSTSLTLSSIAAISLSIIGILASYLVEQYNLIDISGSDSAYFFFCLRLAFILFALKFLEVSLLTIYQGFKRYDVAAGWSVASRLIILIANVVSVTLFYGLDGILFCTLIIQLIYILILAFSIKLSYHFLSFTPRFVFREAKEFLTFGLWTWAQNMMAVFTTQVDKLIVVSTAGLQTLTYYSLGSMLAMQFHSIFFSVSSWVFPIISEKTAKREALGKLYCDSQALLQLFGLGILVILLLLEREILTLWLGSSVYEKSSEYIRVFVYYNFFLLLMILPNFFLNGSSNVKQNTLSEFVLKVLNILFMVSFYYLFGTIGLVWGLVISTAIVVPLKIAQVEKYVLFEKTEFLSIKSIVSATMLILSFQIDQFFGKITFGLLFLVFFYLVFLRKISVQSWLSKILEFKKVLNN